jgi:hypothetical protein
VPVGTILAGIWRRIVSARAEWLPIFRAVAIKAMLDLIRHDLALNIHHDIFRPKPTSRTAARDGGHEVLRAKARFTRAHWSDRRASTRTNWSNGLCSDASSATTKTGR